jgi:hypothetical protein
MKDDYHPQLSCCQNQNYAKENSNFFLFFPILETQAEGIEETSVESCGRNICTQSEEADCTDLRDLGIHVGR